MRRPVGLLVIMLSSVLGGMVALGVSAVFALAPFLMASHGGRTPESYWYVPISILAVSLVFFLNAVGLWLLHRWTYWLTLALSALLIAYSASLVWVSLAKALDFVVTVGWTVPFTAPSVFATWYLCRRDARKLFGVTSFRAAGK